MIDYSKFKCVVNAHVKSSEEFPVSELYNEAVNCTMDSEVSGGS